MNEAQGGPQPGPLVDEAAKLLDAIEGWLRGAAGTAGALLDAEHVATGAAECKVCPLCQLVRALRQTRPETLEHLVDAAGSLIAAARSQLEQRAGGAGAATAARAGAAARGVERIDIG